MGLAAAAGSGCSSAPAEPALHRHQFPRERAFVGADAHRRYKKLGVVRGKVDYSSLDSTHDEDELCRNYYNEAVEQMVKQSRKNGGDAVVNVRSVVFLETTNKPETYATPECSDDGAEGQILTEGTSVRWLTPEEEAEAQALEGMPKPRPASKAEAAKTPR